MSYRDMQLYSAPMLKETRLLLPYEIESLRELGFNYVGRGLWTVGAGSIHLKDGDLVFYTIRSDARAHILNEQVNKILKDIKLAEKKIVLDFKNSQPMDRYHYTMCGLYNVFIDGGYFIHPSDEGNGISIIDMDGLHHRIAESLAKADELTDREVRWL